jgi:hypothetical protein
MINELHSLAETLCKMNIAPDKSPAGYEKLPKAPCYRIWISESGDIAGIDKLGPELVEKLRKYGKRSGTSKTFPAFNLRNTDDEKADDSLKATAQELLGKIPDDSPNSVTKLIDIIARQEIIAVLKNYLEDTGTDDGTAADRKELAEKWRAGKSASVILDFAEWWDFEHPVASEPMAEWIKDALLSAESESGCPERAGELDAFGEPLDARSELMPVVALGSLGRVGLRAMFRGQPCQKRFGRFDDASYPISKSNRSSARSALEWLARPENKYTTWVKADKDEIVFAYPSELPKQDRAAEEAAGYAELLGGARPDRTFEAIAAQFANVYRGLPLSEKPEHIRIFSIRKMDKARSEVVVTRSLAPESYMRAAEEWQTGCLNTPKISAGKQITPFPLDTARIVNAIWKRDGEQKAAVKRIRHYQGLELLLNDSIDAAHYIGILVSNAAGIIACSKEKLKGRGAKIAEIAAMLGLLLYKGGKERCRKEEYMKNTAYLTGQLLKASDELHALYCKVVRSSDKSDGIPPQLAGASMFTAASDAPHSAIAQLGARMNPYIAWAKSYRYKGITEQGKRSSTAWWLLGLFERISTELGGTLTEPARFDDFDKAQFFLGYLAEFPKGDKPNEGIEISEKIIAEGEGNNGQ